MKCHEEEERKLVTVGRNRLWGFCCQQPKKKKKQKSKKKKKEGRRSQSRLRAEAGRGPSPKTNKLYLLGADI